MLVVCATCRRHIRADEAVCPFCRGVTYVHRRVAAVPVGRRLDRFALITFGATGLVACGNGGSSGPALAPPAASASAEPVAASPDPAPSTTSAPSLVATTPPPTEPAPSTVAVAPSSTLKPGVSAYGGPNPGGLGALDNDAGSTVGAYGGASAPAATATFSAPVGTDDDVRVLKSRTLLYRQCYLKDLQANPGIGAAKCDIDVKIGADGKATTAKVTCKGGGPTVQACMDAKTKLAAFPTGAVRDVSIKVVIAPTN